jgi:predicted MPP superfamily phosphohydrolase
LLGRLGVVSRLLVTPFQRAWLDVHLIQLPMPGLTPSFDGYRIAQFSDLHLDGVMMTRKRLEALVEVINEQQPDLIVFTGDFVTKRVEFREEDLIVPLRKLVARDAKLAITGNHDYHVGAGVIERVIAESGMINLVNSVHTLQRGDDSLHIAGVGSLMRRRARLDLVLNRLPETGLAILLAHEPEFIDVSAATGRFILQLSGHTHGGQILIPALTRLLVFGYHMRYIRGAYRTADMLLYVNRGIGTVGLPLRLKSAPELTVFTLREWKYPLPETHVRSDRSGDDA